MLTLLLLSILGAALWMAAREAEAGPWLVGRLMAWWERRRQRKPRVDSAPLVEATSTLDTKPIPGRPIIGRGGLEGWVTTINDLHAGGVLDKGVQLIELEDGSRRFEAVLMDKVTGAVSGVPVAELEATRFPAQLRLNRLQEQIAAALAGGNERPMTAAEIDGRAVVQIGPGGEHHAHTAAEIELIEAEKRRRLAALHEGERRRVSRLKPQSPDGAPGSINVSGGARPAPRSSLIGD